MSITRSYGNVVLYRSQFKELDIGKLTIKLVILIDAVQFILRNLSTSHGDDLWHKGTLTGNNT